MEPEGDAGRPIESGENNHAVSEFEVLGTKIVVWSTPPEDVRSAPLEDARNEETEIGSDKDEVVDSLRRCASPSPEIVADDVVGEGTGHLEEQVGVENVGTGEEELGVDNVGTGEEEVRVENVGTGEEEVGVDNVGNPEVDKGLDNIPEGDKGLDNERDCDDERVEIDSWIDSDADCLGDSDGED